MHAWSYQLPRNPPNTDLYAPLMPTCTVSQQPGLSSIPRRLSISLDLFVTADEMGRRLRCNYTKYKLKTLIATRSIVSTGFSRFHKKSILFLMGCAPFMLSRHWAAALTVSQLSRQHGNGDCWFNAFQVLEVYLGRVICGPVRMWSIWPCYTGEIS